ncbi:MULTISPECIES: ATP-binding protein [unclassified Rhizobium]|uniref:ATP-binding protein n=1 Tax=Rhizobium sp. TaxID=391 RepID=UPI0025FFD880|nr:ATP-binding protein [Rhizobium sp. UBA1881]
MIDESVGAILLTEEALVEDVDKLKAALEAQPSWSDVPFVLLAAPRTSRTPNGRMSQLRLFDLASNSVVLERPLGRASLLSAVASAVRLRAKQFQMRDRVEELDESETRLRLATSAAGVGTWDFDLITGELKWDKRCRTMFGIISGRDVSYEAGFLAGLHPDDRERAHEAVNDALRPDGSGEYEIDYRTIGIEDGVERWIAAKGGTIFMEGKAVRFVGTAIDISERKRTQEALARSEAELRREREALDDLNRNLERRVAQRTAELQEEMAARGRAEEALRQAQKMEAIGQLTGGIAHDFNNMLTGIIGGINLAKRRIASGRVEDVQLAATKELLERTLPETITIELSVPTDVGYALADANQLESALLNLAVNARDAMPQGGRLTITAERLWISGSQNGGLDAGQYVMIDVADTGVGMSPDILEKVFDPFFTTKPIGQGTGLGLSMIYGFAQQSGGEVRIDSTPGKGTSIKLYLPATSDGEMPEARIDTGTPFEGSGQTVLVVEDDDAVRLLICEVLTDLSYRVIEAEDADVAIRVLRDQGKIDLMVSDVGLPGMNGRQLADVARQHRPDLPVLFVTGYAENAATKASFLGTNMGMIGKPFAVEALASKINEMVNPVGRSEQT